MPQKTKAQKVATDQKRREGLISQIHYTPVIVGGPPPLTVADTYKKQSVETKAKSVILSNRTDDYGYVTSDLKRVGVFSLLAFGAEIALWYFLMVR